MPAVKNVGEPCAGEPHARFEVAAGGNQASRASTCRAARAPLADPTNGFGSGGVGKGPAQAPRRRRTSTVSALLEQLLGTEGASEPGSTER